MKQGGRGSIIVTEDAPPIIQPAILAPMVLDTIGARDNFTIVFSIGLLEKKSPSDSLKFAGYMLIFNSKYHPILFCHFLFSYCERDRRIYAWT